MKNKLILLSCMVLLAMGSSFSQCNDPTGIGGFEMGSVSDGYFAGTQGKGEISLSTSEFYSGAKSLYVNAYQLNYWEVRIRQTNASCEFTKSVNQTITVALYAKGEVGDRIIVALMNGTNTEVESVLTLTSPDWRRYLVSLKSESNALNGNIRLQFRDEGEYYIDELSVNAYDCSGALGGAASLDSCGLCSGGNTGVAFNTSCNYQSILPTDPNIRLDGVMETEMNGGNLVPFRMPKSYSSASYSTSGVEVVFKTASPSVKAHFVVDETNTPGSTYWSGFGLFRDGELVQEVRKARGNVNVEMLGENLVGGVVEWRVTLPALSAAQFVGLEILDGYALVPVAENTKPKYVAIGNSITHGVGTVFHHTHDTYPWIVADSLGYELYNWGIGGSAVTDAILNNFDGRVTPDLVSVLWGYNDVHSSTNPDVLDQSVFPKYRTILETALTQFPNTCVMAILSTYTTNMVDDTYPSRTITALRDGQLAIIQDLQQTYSNLQYFDGASYTTYPEALQDAVHLSIDGNKSLGEGFISEEPCGLILAVSNHSERATSVFPNPTSGIVHWSEGLDVQLTNISGEVIFNGKTDHFDLSSYPNGFYFLKTTEGVTKILKD